MIVGERGDVWAANNDTQTTDGVFNRRAGKVKDGT